MLVRSLFFGIVLSVAVPAAAASPFDGTWKIDVKSAQLPKKPDVLLLKNGVYTCSSCTPAFTVKADGTFHKITGQPYFDEAMVKIVDANSLMESDKRKGKLVYTSATKVAADGKTATVIWTDSSSPSGKTTKGEVRQVRVGPAPAGAHAVSGQWMTTGFGGISDAVLTVSFLVAGDRFSMKTPAGYSIDAPLGGKPVPVVGDPSNVMAAVRKVDDRTLVETDTRAGEVISVYTYTALPDGKTIKVVSENRKQGTTTTYAMKRQ